jgi:hypothetical protein
MWAGWRKSSRSTGACVQAKVTYVAVDAAGGITSPVPVVSSPVPAGLTDADRASLARLARLEALEGEDPGLVAGLMESAFAVLGGRGFRPKPVIAEGGGRHVSDWAPNRCGCCSSEWRFPAHGRAHRVRGLVHGG